MAEAAYAFLTVDEFLAWDPGDEFAYELVAGRPVALAAPSGAHQILAVNFGRRLAEALDQRPPCTARSETPIAVSENTCHIADLAVTCAPHQPGQRSIPSPVVIVEILSPSTEHRDRRVKLPDYRALPTVQEIVLIDQDQLYCEVHRRLDDGRWLTDLLRTPDAHLRLPSIGFDQNLATLYVNVDLQNTRS